MAPMSHSGLVICGNTHRTRHSVVLTANSYYSTRHKAKPAGGKVTYLQPSPEDWAQASMGPPPEVTQDLLNSSGHTASQHLQSGPCQVRTRSPLKTGLRGSLCPHVPKSQTLRQKTGAWHKPHCTHTHTHSPRELCLSFREMSISVEGILIPS